MSLCCCSLPLCRAMVDLLKTAQLLPRHDTVPNRSCLLENVKKTISSSARRFSGHQQHVCIVTVWDKYLDRRERNLADLSRRYHSVNWRVRVLCRTPMNCYVSWLISWMKSYRPTRRCLMSAVHQWTTSSFHYDRQSTVTGDRRTCCLLIPSVKVCSIVKNCFYDPQLLLCKTDHYGCTGFYTVLHLMREWKEGRLLSFWLTQICHSHGYRAQVCLSL